MGWSKNRVPCLPVRLDVQTDALMAKQFGLQLDLPESPTIVLAGLANGQECVLVLDQLDALSFASGRNQRLWDAFDELLHEAERYPNMRVLLVCREFDAQHDPRLRAILADTEHTESVKLQPLTLDTVRSVVAKAGAKPETLNDRALKLLQIPLHLSLYLHGNPLEHPGFKSVQELLERYWEHKRREAGKDVQWREVIKKLADWLSDQQTLSAPIVALDELAEDAARLCTLNVLVRDGQQFRFFHEAFFDYAWARIFVGEQRRLRALLLASEQHLFRRAQVRQVLDYERGTPLQNYLRDLGDLLTEPRIRFHLKRLTLDWLRSLDDPREEEWALLCKVAPNGAFGRLAMRVPFASVPWFDLLLRLGEWQRWLASSDDEQIAHAVWLLSIPEVMRARSREIVGLFTLCMSGTKPWSPIFSRLFGVGEVHHSPEMFDLFCGPCVADISTGQIGRSGTRSMRWRRRTRTSRRNWLVGWSKNMPWRKTALKPALEIGTGKNFSRHLQTKRPKHSCATCCRR